jgi:hypothetical protein
MFHRHHWLTVGEKYTPRDSDITSFHGNTDEDTYLKVVYGLTVISQQCDGCGLLKTEGIPGQTIGAS